MHIFDDFVRPSANHLPDAGHTPHAGAEFEVTFFLDIDSPIRIHTVYFPNRCVFHGVVVANCKALARLQGQHEQRLPAFYRRNVQF